MAFEKYFTNNSQFKLILDWTYTQDIASNTSSVTAILKLQSMAYGQTYGWANKSSTISIADNSDSSTVNVNMSPNQTKELWRRTATVYHNADGTRTFYLSASVNYTGISWGGVALGNITVGGNVTLPTIPRASTLSISSTHSVLNETNITYTIKRASTAFTHDLYWSFYNQNNTGFTWVTGQWDYIGGIKKNGTTTATAKLPLTDRILQLMPNETNTWIYIYLDTFNGSTLIGRNWYRMDISLPSSVKPTVSINALVEMNTTIKGIMGTSGELVMSASQPQIQISPTASKHASITSYEYRDPWGHVVSHNGPSWNFERPKGALTSGSYSARVLDSRGRWSDWVSIGRKIHEWYNPSIQSFDVYRDPTQQHIVKIDAKGAISSLEGKNTADYWIDVFDGSNWVNKDRIRLDNNQFNFTQTVQLSDNYDIARGFSFRVNFTDRIANSTSTFNLSTAKVLLHYHKDIGVGIGKMHEEGALDVGGKLHTRDKIIAYENIEFKNVKTIYKAGIYGGNGTFTGSAYSSSFWNQFPSGYSAYWVSSSQVTNLPEGSYGFLEVLKEAYLIRATWRATVGGSNSYYLFFNTNTNEKQDWTKMGFDYHYEQAVSFPDGAFESYSNTFNDGQYAKFYVRNYSTVTLTGAVKNKIEIGAGWLGIIAKLPARFAPRHRHLVLAQGSGNNMFLLEIQTNGNIVLSRYRNSASNNYISVGSWLNIDCTYNINLT